MKLEEMTKDEKSLVLFLECCAVDNGGRVNGIHMNNEDFDIVEKWKGLDLIKFGRICSKDCNHTGTYWVQFTQHAFALAHEERIARSVRMWNKRTWKTTEEHRNE